MHILFVADGDDRYGAPHSLLQMVSELLKIDHSLKVSVVLTKNSSMAIAFSDLGCDVYRIPYYPFYQSLSNQRWKSVIKYLLHGVQYIFGRWFGSALLAKRMDITSVDLIHANSTREDFGAILAKKYSKPLIWHIREFGDLDYSCYSYRRDYIDLINRTATECIAISDAVREHWIKKGVDENKIIRIYNGVDAAVEIKKNYNLGVEQRVNFIFVGRLTETKGQKQLIEALGQLPLGLRRYISVDIVGDGRKAYCEELEKMIRERELDRIINMKGYQRDFYKNLTKYDCGIICSKSEAFGRVTAEYMMAGLPVIASATGANPELLRDGENGLLYNRDNTLDLAEKLKLMLLRPDLRERMGRKGADYAQKYFTAYRNAEFVYKEYKKVLKV